VFTLVLFAALTFPPQENLSRSPVKTPVQPEQVLAWQLEGLRQEEIREEVSARGLTNYPEIAFLSALSAARADLGGQALTRSEWTQVENRRPLWNPL
jgi:hypothetical protein